MGRDLSAALQLQSLTAHSDVPVYWFLEVETPEDPPRRIRFVNNPEAVEFGTDSEGVPIVYSPGPFSIQPIEESRQNEQSVLQVVIGAKDNGLSHMVDGWDGLDDQPVRILLVSQLDLGDTSAATEFTGRISGAAMREVEGAPGIAFEVSAGNLLEETMPKRRTGKSRCGVKYASLECGVIIPTSPTNTVGGGFSFCPRNLAACEERGDDEVARGLPRQHPRRFDAFPGIPRAGARTL